MTEQPSLRTQGLAEELSLRGSPERLATLRKKRGLTQHALAEDAGINVSQVRRYDGDTSHLTVEVLRKLAFELHTSADALLFEQAQRGPHGDLRLKFEAVEAMDDDEQMIVASLIEAYIKKHRMERVMAQ